jgi:hypothetical protein
VSKTEVRLRGGATALMMALALQEVVHPGSGYLVVVVILIILYLVLDYNMRSD